MARFDFDRMIAGWRGPLLAALIAVLAGLPSLLMLPPLDRDESRFAQATVQMLESGDYIDIRFQDEARHKKPIGIYWLQSAAVSLVSSPEARDIRAFRLPSLLGAALAAAAVAWAGAAMFGSRAGFAAGALMAATFMLSTEAGIAKTDAVLCGAVTLAMAALARLYLAARDGRKGARLHKLFFWLGLSLSILVKGPIGLLVILPVLLILSVWDRDLRLVKGLGWGWGLALMALIVGPWAIAITIATDGGFWREAIGGDLAPKLAGAQESHGAPPGFYLLLSPLLLYPATLLLPAALTAGWRRRGEPAIRFLICWLVPAWLIFELAPTKLPHYTLPTFGALALLAGAALTQPIGPWSRRLGAGLMVFAGLLIAVVAVYGLNEYGGATAQTWAALTVGIALVGAVVAAFLLLKQATGAAVVTALVTGVLAHGLLAGEIRQLRPLSVSPQLDQALTRAGLHPRQGLVTAPVAIAGYHEPSFVFLTGAETQLTDAEGAARALSEGRPVIVEARQADAFRAAAARLGLAPAAAGEVTGFNYSKGDELTLTLYAPSRPTAPRAARVPAAPAPVPLPEAPDAPPPVTILTDPPQTPEAESAPDAAEQSPPPSAPTAAADVPAAPAPETQP